MARAAVIVSVLAFGLAVLGIAAQLFGPAYQTGTVTVTSDGTTTASEGYATMLEVGAPLAFLAFVTLMFALMPPAAYLYLVRDVGAARWLVVGPTLIVTFVTVISFGLGATLFPATVLAWLALGLVLVVPTVASRR